MYVLDKYNYLYLKSVLFQETIALHIIMCIYLHVDVYVIM